MIRVTVVLLNYKRPHHLRLILSRLGEQSEPVETLVVNNAGTESFGADREVYVPWNAMPFIRFAFALYATTPWVMFLDDDVLPADEDFVRDALEIAGERGNRITGAYGRRFNRLAPHYRADATGEVEIIKGRFMLMRRGLLSYVQMPIYPDQFPVGLNDDIYVSLEIGRCRATHWADPSLQSRLGNLPEGDEALSLRPGHMEEREAFCKWYLRHRS